MRTFIIAEFGMLHDGSFGNACRMVDTAKESRADAVKFQTHIARAETLRDAPMPPFFKGEPRWQYFERTSFTPFQWAELKAHCDKQGIEFMSSPFSIEAIDILENIGMQRYKIPSGEVTNIPFLERIARTKKPVILSSGMSNWAELDCAVAVLKKSPLTILQCTSLYPTPLEKVGLNVMLEMKKRYGVEVGLSDQSLNNYAAYAAAALGASMIEKHVTLSRHAYGSDSAHSIEPAEFAQLVCGVRAIETILSNPVDKDNLTDFVEMKRVFEKSIVSLKKIPAGTVITETMIGLKKPGNGLSPKRYHSIIGKRASGDIAEGKILEEKDIA